MSDIGIILIFQIAVIVIAIVGKCFLSRNKASDTSRRPERKPEEETGAWKTTQKIKFSKNPNVPQEPEVPLKPCPFCGSSPKILDNGVWRIIACFGCGAQISNLNRGYHGGNPEDLWNRRADENEL